MKQGWVDTGRINCKVIHGNMRCQKAFSIYCDRAWDSDQIPVEMCQHKRIEFEPPPSPNNQDQANEY